MYITKRKFYSLSKVLITKKIEVSKEVLIWKFSRFLQPPPPSLTAKICQAGLKHFVDVPLPWNFSIKNSKNPATKKKFLMFLKFIICFKKQREIKGVTVYSKKNFSFIFFHPGVSCKDFLKVASFMVTRHFTQE